MGSLFQPISVRTVRTVFLPIYLEEFSYQVIWNTTYRYWTFFLPSSFVSVFLINLIYFCTTALFLALLAVLFSKSNNRFKMSNNICYAVLGEYEYEYILGKKIQRIRIWIYYGFKFSLNTNKFCAFQKAITNILEEFLKVSFTASSTVCMSHSYCLGYKDSFIPIIVIHRRKELPITSVQDNIFNHCIQANRDVL